jgi:hypothetical protein
MICPMMSKPIQKMFVNGGKFAKDETNHSILHEVECKKENCALWVTVTKMPSGKQEERCGLIQ